MSAEANKKFSPAQIVIVIVAVLLMFGTSFLPPIFGLTLSGMRVLAILIAGLMIWLFVGIEWASILILMSLMMIPELGPGAVMAGSLGNGTVYFLILTFMLSASLAYTGVAKRLAIWFMTSKLSRKGPWFTVGMIYISIFVLASGLSATATLLVFIPIFYEIFKTLSYEKSDKDPFPSMMMLGLVVIAQLAQSTTPISHAMTLIGMATYGRMTGNEMSFFDYTSVAMPIGIVILVLWFLLCRFVLKPDVSRMSRLDFDSIKAQQGPMSTEEKIASFIYLTVVVLWVMPGLTQQLIPALSPIFSGIHQNYPPTVGIVLLHFIRIKGKPVLPYDEAIKAVPWNLALFMGCLLMIGTAFSNGDIGLQTWIPEVLGPALGGVSGVVFLVILILILTLITNFLSIAVVIAIGMTIAIPLALSIFSGQINPTLVAIMITAVAQYSYATAPSTPPAAVAIGSGWTVGKLYFWQGMAIAFIGAAVLLILGFALGNVIHPA